MANALLYYRTPTTKTSTISDPNNLPAAQKLSFIAPDDHTQGIEENWVNNIARKIPVKPKGRKIIQRDEGISGWDITISGYWTVGIGDSDSKLNLFRRLPQEDSFHIHGIMGLLYPNGPSYLNIDPTNIKGMMITGTKGTHKGNTHKIMDFSCGLSVGGDVS